MPHCVFCQWKASLPLQKFGTVRARVALQSLFQTGNDCWHQRSGFGEAPHSAVLVVLVGLLSI